MLSRRGLYRTKRGTIIYILRWMAPYYIELIARNPALKIQIWRSLLYCAMTSRQLTPLLARRDKCQKQNADPIYLFRDNSMDLEFNIQGCGLHKSWRGLKILHFGTSVVCWGCPGVKFFFIPQCYCCTYWFLCFNPYECKGKSKIAKRGTLVRFAHNCAHCARRIRLKIWPTVHHLLLHIVTFMLQPSKMQGEARNYKNRHFGALRAQLCALRARDHAVGPTVPAFLPDGPSVRILSLCDNSFYHFFLALFPNGGDPPVLFPLRTRLKKGTSSLRSEVKKKTGLRCFCDIRISVWKWTMTSFSITSLKDQDFGTFLLGFSAFLTLVPYWTATEFQKTSEDF